MNPSRLFRTLAPLCFLFLGNGCGHDHGHTHPHGEDGHEHPHDGDEHADEHGEGHVHEAPNGGVLVVLAEEAANLEVVLQADEGALNLFLLDGHCSDYVRTTQTAILVALDLPEGEVTLEVPAQASSLSGETVGDSSWFLLRDERLKGLSELQGRVLRVESMGAVYEDLPFSLGSKP